MRLIDGDSLLKKWIFMSKKERENFGKTILYEPEVDAVVLKEKEDPESVVDFENRSSCCEAHDKWFAVCDTCEFGDSPLEDERKTKMKFKGDIVITDPCYIIDDDNDSDWNKCECGECMENLGIKHYLCRDTIYGDWSCTTYDSDTGEVLGEFCADAGMVAVFLLDEVLAYNPKFKLWEESPWAATLIKDFDGDVEMKVVHTEGVYEDDGKWHKKGDKWEDDSLSVVGVGNVNFETRQTGF